jgi:hypothetical protein
MSISRTNEPGSNRKIHERKPSPLPKNPVQSKNTIWGNSWLSVDARSALPGQLPAWIDHSQATFARNKIAIPRMLKLGSFVTMDTTSPIALTNVENMMNLRLFAWVNPMNVNPLQYAY